jgi:hypothetical protein
VLWEAYHVPKPTTPPVQTVEPISPVRECITISKWKDIVTFRAGTVSFTEMNHNQSVAAEIAYYAMPPSSAHPANVAPTEIVVIAGEAVNFNGLAGTFASNGCGLLSLKLNAKLSKAMRDAAGVK